MKTFFKGIKILFAKLLSSYVVIDDKPTGTLFRLNKQTLKNLQDADNEINKLRLEQNKGDK